MSTARELIEKERARYAPDGMLTDGAQTYHEAAERVIERLVENVEGWAKWASSSRCIYCDAEFHHTLEQSDADVLKKQHILVCEKHPYRQMLEERDRATAAHVACDRERQEALDRVRELEKLVKSLEDGPCVDYREIVDEQRDYRDRLEESARAWLCFRGGRWLARDIKAAIQDAGGLTAAIDAAVAARFSGEGK